MEMAFVLLNSEIGFEKDVLEDLKDIPEVREAFRLYSVYDIIIQVEADTVGDLKELIMEIRQMEKVRYGMTIQGRKDHLKLYQISKYLGANPPSTQI